MFDVEAYLALLDSGQVQEARDMLAAGTRENLQLIALMHEFGVYPHVRCRLCRVKTVKREGWNRLAESDDRVHSICYQVLCLNCDSLIQRRKIRPSNARINAKWRRWDKKNPLANFGRYEVTYADGTVVGAG